MAKSSFLTLCQTVRERCGIQGSGPVSVTDQTGVLLRIVNWTREAAYEIETKYTDWNFRWAQFSTTLIASPVTSEYSKPTDHSAWDPESFYLDYGTSTVKSLKKYEWKEYRDNLGRSPATATKPSVVVIKPDKNLLVYPPPDAGYTLSADYWVKPTKMTANTDTCLIPEEFEMIIVARAMMSFAGEEGAGVLLDSAELEYEYFLHQLETQELPDQGNRGKAQGESMVVVAE